MRGFILGTLATALAFAAMPSFGRYEQCAELVRRLRAREGAAHARASA